MLSKETVAKLNRMRRRKPARTQRTSQAMTWWSECRRGAAMPATSSWWNRERCSDAVKRASLNVRVALERMELAAGNIDVQAHQMIKERECGPTF